MCSFFIITNLYNGILYILVLITREIEPVIIVGGHLVNEVINKIVKFLVKSPRPKFHADFGSNSKYGLTYGFPSAHSQFMGFLLVIILVLSYLKFLTCQRNIKELFV